MTFEERRWMRCCDTGNVPRRLSIGVFVDKLGPHVTLTIDEHPASLVLDTLEVGELRGLLRDATERRRWMRCRDATHARRHVGVGPRLGTYVRLIVLDHMAPLSLTSSQVTELRAVLRELVLAAAASSADAAAVAMAASATGDLR